MKIRSHVCLLSLVFLFGCKQDAQVPTPNLGYPADVNKIVATRCATAGCHTTADKALAGNLSLLTWDEAMQGSDDGTAVVPFRSNRSLMFLHSNDYSDLGGMNMPMMPTNGSPLSHDEVKLIKDWIDNGAPDVNGHIAYSGPNRTKFYVTDQGCDEIAVVDGETGAVMRYISVGVTASGESPHAIKISPDKHYAYVTFALGTAVQKIDCETDQVVGTIDVGFGLWNSIVISPDGHYGVITDWQPTNGRISILDFQNNSVLQSFSGIDNAHGLAASADFKTIYATHSSGNDVYKIDLTDIQNPVLQFPNVSLGGSDLTEHDIIFSPDGLRYFVTCQATNEVRVMQASNDSLLAVLPTGTYPQEFAVSTTQPYLFVTCMEDPSPLANTRGSVYVFDYNTLAQVAVIQPQEEGDFFQPHGIAVDDQHNRVLVANRNQDSSGPPPHHTSDCGGRAGFLKMINLNTLDFISDDYAKEVTSDPYGAAARVVW